MNPVRAAIFTRLNADATLTALLSAEGAIFNGVAPQSARPPYVVFNRQAGTPEWQFGGEHFQQDVWLVKGIDKGATASGAEDIAARIDAVLTDAPLAVTDRHLLGVWRESDVDYAEVVGGETYYHVGSQYRLVTEPT